MQPELRWGDITSSVSRGSWVRTTYTIGYDKPKFVTTAWLTRMAKVK